MGSCSSVNKDTGSAITYRLCADYKGRRFFVSSPAKEKPPSDGENLAGGFGSRSPEFVNKGEVFFDSHAWLDSDCEDDFFSVKGDFTPSRGSTPIHHFSTPSTAKLENSFFVDKYPDSKSEPSPTSRKKLAELFRETLQVDQQADMPNATEVQADKNSGLHKTRADQNSRSFNDTPSRSGALSFCSSGKVTPTRDPRIRKDKIWKTQQCCLPSLHSFGFDDRRHKMSPKPCIA